MATVFIPSSGSRPVLRCIRIHILITAFFFLLPLILLAGGVDHGQKRYSFPGATGQNKEERAKFASSLADKVNTAIFNSNPELDRIMREEADRKRPKEFKKVEGPLPLSQNKQTFLSEKDRDTASVVVSKDRKEVTVALNTKERKYKANGPYETSNIGYQPDRHRPAIQEALRSVPELKDSKITVLGPVNPPRTVQENAAPHAEMQHLKNHMRTKHSRRSSWPIASSIDMGVSKEPCANCAPVLQQFGVNHHAAGGTSLDKSKIKQWSSVDKIDVKVLDTFPVSNGRSASSSSVDSRRASISGSPGNAQPAASSANSRRASISGLPTNAQPAANSRRASIPAPPAQPLSSAVNNNRRASFSGPESSSSVANNRRASLSPPRAPAPPSSPGNSRRASISMPGGSGSGSGGINSRGGGSRSSSLAGKSTSRSSGRA